MQRERLKPGLGSPGVIVVHALPNFGFPEPWLLSSRTMSMT